MKRVKGPKVWGGQLNWHLFPDEQEFLGSSADAYLIGGLDSHHSRPKTANRTLLRASDACRTKTLRRTLRCSSYSGTEQSSRALRKEVHFLCRVLWPPQSPCTNKNVSHIIMLEQRKLIVCDIPMVTICNMALTTIKSWCGRNWQQSATCSRHG